MAERSALLRYILHYPETLLYTDFLREIFMIPDRLTGVPNPDGSFLVSTRAALYPRQLFVVTDQFYSVTEFTRIDNRGSDVRTYRVTAAPTGIPYDPDRNTTLCTPQDPFILTTDDIITYHGDPVETTLGIFIANWLFLVYPCGDVIPYLNEEITVHKLETRVGAALIDGQVSVEQVKDRYINTLSLHGTACEMFCPNITEKTITIPPEIHALRKRLVAEHAVELAAGDATVMSAIEGELIAAYKAYLKGDPSMHFLLKSKYFNVTLKKLFLTQGMTEVFGSPGKFVFVEQPMGQGWQQKDLSTIYNEVRSGSYSRAIETANGGVIAKLILRVFQDTRIAIPDCGTTRGESVYGSDATLKDFIGSYVVADDGTTTLLTQATAANYRDRSLRLRTPGYCESPHGFCAKCFGVLFEKLGQEAIAPIANDVARHILVASLKAMHGKSHATVEVRNLDRYLIAA